MKYKPKTMFELGTANHESEPIWKSVLAGIALFVIIALLFVGGALLK